MENNKVRTVDVFSKWCQARGRKFQVSRCHQTLGLYLDDSGDFSIAIKNPDYDSWLLVPVTIEALEKFVQGGKLDLGGNAKAQTLQTWHPYFETTHYFGSNENPVLLSFDTERHMHNQEVPLIQSKRRFSMLKVVTQDGSYGTTDLNLFREMVASEMGIKIKTKEAFWAELLKRISRKREVLMAIPV